MIEGASLMSVTSTQNKVAVSHDGLLLLLLMNNPRYIICLLF